MDPLSGLIDQRLRPLSQFNVIWFAKTAPFSSLYHTICQSVHILSLHVNVIKGTDQFDRWSRYRHDICTPEIVAILEHLDVDQNRRTGWRQNRKTHWSNIPRLSPAYVWPTSGKRLANRQTCWASFKSIKIVHQVHCSEPLSILILFSSKFE